MSSSPAAEPAGRVRVDVVDDAEAASLAVATELLDAIDGAAADGRSAVLGCPAGRTPRGTFRALGRGAARRALDLSRLQVVMMDEFVVDGADGFVTCSPDAHFSCRRAAEVDLLAVVNSQLPHAHRIAARSLHVPDPADPASYDDLIDRLGGIDVFLLASGASDGHVAFNPPGCGADDGTHVVRLADSTRHDNLSTFPAFGSIDEVPQHGVTVGLGTIVRASRRAVLLLLGEAKHESFRRVVGTAAFDPAWPATIVHRCRSARVVADRAASVGNG